MQCRLFTLVLAGFLLTCNGCFRTKPKNAPPVSPNAKAPKVSVSALAHRSIDGAIDWDAALTAAVICKAAYLADEPEKAALRDIGFSTVQGFTKDSSHAVVCSNEDVVVIVFRGTDQLSDWVINADLRREKVKDGDIHRGFHEATMSLYTDLLKAAIEQGATSKAVCITGHSLGGAMAIAFAYEASARNDIEITSLCTYGQPLLLSRPLAEHINTTFGQRYRRFVNGSDAVTRLLPKFRHAGSRVHFTGEGFELLPPSVAFKGVDEDDDQHDPEAMTEEEYMDLKKELQATKEFDSVDGERAVARGQIPWLADHSMEQYESRIRQAPK